MGNNSYRDIARAKRVKWAIAEKLNLRAIEIAGRYLNLDEQMIRLISAYENASDLPAGDLREVAMRAAWHNVIAYMRLLSRREVEAA
jgi:hypothetical protein